MEPNMVSNSSRTLRVAAVQMPSENGRVSSNLSHATPLIERASKEGAQIVLLPELMPTGYYLGEAIWQAAEQANGPTVTWLKQMSLSLGIWLGTSFLEADGKDFYNTFVLSNPLGEVAGHVRKQTPATWEAYLFKGERGPHVIDTSLGRIGVSICFESQTAAVASRLSSESVDLVLMPHCYPVPAVSSGLFRRDRMISVLEAIPTLYVSLLGVPVVLSNKCGPWVSPVPGPQLVNTTGSCFPGLSAIINSDGSVMGRLGEEEGVIVADVTIEPARKKHSVPPHYGRYVTPGPPRRSLVRLIEGMGRLSYALNSTRKTMARAVSLPKS